MPKLMLNHKKNLPINQSWRENYLNNQNYLLKKLKKKNSWHINLQLNCNNIQVKLK